MPTLYDDISPTPPGAAERKRKKRPELRRLFAEASALAQKVAAIPAVGEKPKVG